MKGLIAAAHAKGMKVFFDIITNHTADVISYQQNQYTYISKADQPYKDANGNAFDDPRSRTPPRSPAGPPSFPYTPVFPTARRRHREVPGVAQRPDDIPQPR